MAVSVPASLNTMLQRSALHLATLWKLERADGVTMRFTDHNALITFNAETYTPIGSVDSSAVQKQSDLKADNLEFRGVISSSAITHDELRAGRYREAKVTEYVIDWMFPFIGAIATRVFWIMGTQFTEEVWIAEVSGQSSWLRAKVGAYYNRTCDTELGSARCAVDTGALTISVTVSTVETQRRIVTTDINPATFPTDDWWRYGPATWTAGANINLVSEVKTSVAATGRIEFFIPTPFDIEVGDTFDIFPGCDKLFSTCKDKFDNAVNFQGFPYVPGNDTMLKVSRRKK